MKKKLTDEHIKKIKLMLRTMNQAHIARELGLSKSQIYKAVTKLKLFDKDLYINKRAPTEHNIIRNSKEMKEFCIEEWKRRPCLNRIARIASRYFGIRVGIKTVKKHVLKKKSN
jgi:transposase